MKLTIIIILLIVIYYIFINKETNINKEKFEVYCNNKNDDKYDFFSKNTIINQHLNKVNTTNIPKYIYTSKSLIPYNYSDNMDNNLIYNLNSKKKDRIMRLEKINYGKLMPSNSKLLTNNYNKNLNGFLVDNEVPVGYKYNGCKKIPKYDGEVCSINKIDSSLLGRYKKFKLHINWNLPTNCLDIKEFYLLYKREKHNNNNNYKLIKINYNNKTEELIFKQGKLIVYKDFNHLKYNFYFDKPITYKCFIYLKINGKEIYSNIFE